MGAGEFPAAAESRQVAGRNGDRKRGRRRAKGRAFGSPLARGLYPRASTAEVDPRAKPWPPAAVAAPAYPRFHSPSQVMHHDNFVTQTSPSTASGPQGEERHDHIPRGLRGRELLVHDLQRGLERDEVSARAAGGAFQSVDVRAARLILLL